MSRYLGTFSRHKVALILPIVIALTISGWYAKSVPHKYVGSMTVWFDTTAPNPSSLENPLPYTSPAAQGQSVLNEFLGSQQFLVKVGHRGPMAALFGKTSSSSGVVDSEILSILGKAFAVSVTGPQIVKITMTAPDPSYIPGTLNAVAAGYVAEITAALKDRDAASVSTYESQVTAARRNLNSANSAVLTFLQGHPGQLATTDPTYSQLAQVAQQAQTNYTSAQTSLQQATLALQNIQAPSSFHVVDPAVAAFRLSNKKHMIFTVVAGLAAGLVISALALSALTALDKTARRQEDIDGVLGMEVVAIIRDLPPQRRLPGLKKSKSS